MPALSCAPGAPQLGAAQKHTGMNLFDVWENIVHRFEVGAKPERKIVNRLERAGERDGRDIVATLILLILNLRRALGNDQSTVNTAILCENGEGCKSKETK
eukprot:UC4_evm3s426